MAARGRGAERGTNFGNVRAGERPREFRVSCVAVTIGLFLFADAEEEGRFRWLPLTTGVPDSHLPLLMDL